MKKKLLYIAMLLMTAVGFTACDNEQAMPPMIYPEQIGDGSGASPYSVGTAITKIITGDYTQKKVFIRGYVSQIDDFNASYGNITYYISDDGTTTNQLEVYRGMGLNGDKFAAITDLKVGDMVIIYGEMTYYNNSTPEITQGSIIVSLNGSPYDAVEAAQPEGDGSGENPYNVAAANDVLASGDIPTGDVYVKGIICKIDNIDTSFGNATYYISDSGTNFDALEVYRGYGLNGAKFTSTTDIKVGDAVIILGKIVNFNGTFEFTTGSKIVSLNGSAYDPTQGGGGGSGSTAEPAGAGTQADPYNVAMAQKIITDGTYTTDKVYVAGTISKIDKVDTGYGNATYFISDDGTAAGELEVYRGYYLNGDKFTAEDQIKVGDKVVIYGALTNFNGTHEITTGSQIVSLNGEGGGNQGGGGENPPASGDVIYSGLLANDANAMANWTIADVTLPEGGTYVWSWKEYNSAYYLNGSGYVGGAAQAAEAYAFTEIDLAGYKTVTAEFEHAAKFQTTLQQLCGFVVRVKGENNWNMESIPTWPAAGSWTFVSSGSIDLSAYAGKNVEIGFKYGSSTSGADTWEIKNFTLKGSK